MNIIIEGPDNSGKSTLIEYLRQSLPVFGVQASEGPEEYEGELANRVIRYNRFDHMIFDRHPCISDIIYSSFRGGTSLSDEMIAKFYTSDIFIVYCRGRGLEDHIINEAVDTPEHMELVEKNHPNICLKYDQWALDHAHMIYKIGDDMALTLNLIKGAITHDRSRTQRNTRPV